MSNAWNPEVLVYCSVKSHIDFRKYVWIVIIFCMFEFWTKKHVRNSFLIQKTLPFIYSLKTYSISIYYVHELRKDKGKKLMVIGKSNYYMYLTCVIRNAAVHLLPLSIFLSVFFSHFQFLLLSIITKVYLYRNTF